MAGSLTREIVCSWTVPWVEGVAEALDPMVNSAMQWLHGFDLTASKPWTHGHDRLDECAQRSYSTHLDSEYETPLTEVRDLLEEWQADCAAYDADPEAWREAKVAVARATADAEHRGST